MQVHDVIEVPRSVEDERPMTRREAAEFLTSRGFRISYSTMTKLCSPAIDEGPQSCGLFGRDCMYYPTVLLDWANKRMSAGRRVG